MSVMTETDQRIRLVEPLPGFSDETDYTLEPIDEAGLLWSMRSVHDPALRFVLTPAAVFFPDYVPDLAGALETTLGSDEVDLLLVLTVGSALADATANLRAPIVFAPRTRRAVQVVLDDEALSMRQPLVSL